ncbi:TetR/AcrR family transcriptional regulator [Limnobacter litoralis]|uniref:Transcriptional regulator n=1 Tax=Limnobacter litoralis TaxID=481366 RepID=A0ABQ5YLS6_9BURK|nr:TetR/AcrR family transcriptional regulator [Limnobacter litoralis]GLR25077.1 transcriptional regulator [Limnobacter litoralis]
MAVTKKADGRVVRGKKNRELIVNALMACIREGNPSPTAQEVSERAGVGLRTVFRHFEDMETLYRELANEVSKILQPVLESPIEGKTWEEKLVHIVNRRSDMFELLLPLHQATQVHLHESPFLKQQKRFYVQMQRNLLTVLLPETLAKSGNTLEALDLLLSIETWARLRIEQGLAAPQAAQVLQNCVLTLSHAASLAPSETQLPTGSSR